MQEIKKNYGLILKGGNITLSDFTFERPFALLGNNLLVKVIGGGYSYISSSSVLRNASIGRYCSIGDNVCVGVGRHALSWASTASMTSTSFLFDDICSFGNFDGRIAPCKQLDWWPAHTKIGHDVWFGTGVFIPGAHDISIGTGAVVAGKAVVTKDIPAYAIAAGNPAKVVKMRFSDEIIADLLSSKWWEYDLNYFYAKTGIKVPMNDIKAFLSFLAEHKENLENSRFSCAKQVASCDGKNLQIKNLE